MAAGIRRAIGDFIIGGSSINGGKTPLGYEQISLAPSEIKTLNAPEEASLAMIKVEVSPVRFRDDGTDPSASLGMPLAVGERLDYYGNIAALKFIPQGHPAKINVLYYGVSG